MTLSEGRRTPTRWDVPHHDVRFHDAGVAGLERLRSGGYSRQQDEDR